jgi:DNA-binding NtrC family response regulator
LVEEGSFRADLFHRLNVIRVALPPLRDRGDDLEALILEFARHYVSLHEPIEFLEPDLIDHLRTYRFDGNVRELENAVQRMLFNKGEGKSFTRGDWLDQEWTPNPGSARCDDMVQATKHLWLAMVKQDVALPELIRRIERDLLQRALQLEGKTRRDLAKLLHTSERTLYHKLNSHGMAKSARRATNEARMA